MLNKTSQGANRKLHKQIHTFLHLKKEANANLPTTLRILIQLKSSNPHNMLRLYVNLIMCTKQRPGKKS